jgi:hypothetical protein
MTCSSRDRMQVFGGALPPDRVVGHRNEGRDRLQQLLAMAERRDTDVLEIPVGQPAQKLAVNIAGSENLGILGETEPAEPTVDVQVQSNGLLSAAVSENG